MNKKVINKVLNHFEKVTDSALEFVIRAPGRINLIGEHTDYNNGLVLPGAIDKALCFAVGLNQKSLMRFWALDIDKYGEVKLSDIKKTDEIWLDYLLGIAEQFQKLGHSLQGIDVVFGGDLPIGAGVSSSAALECGMAMIWNELLNASLDRVELAQLAQRSSHQFLGVPCGIMDQFASLNGQKDELILLDCKDLSFEIKKADIEDCDWVLLNTTVSHQLADSEYPLRVQECKKGLAKLKKYFPTIDDLRDASLEQLDTLKKELSSKEYKRCYYVITEHDRTLQMIAALENSDAKQVGQLLSSTHKGLRDDYEVSCPEIECFFDFAEQHQAVYGSRLMGGGFGGCTLNLVKSKEKKSFVEAALAHYQLETGRTGNSIDVKLSAGVELLTKTDWK